MLTYEIKYHQGQALFPRQFVFLEFVSIAHEKCDSQINEKRHTLKNYQVKHEFVN